MDNNVEEIIPNVIHISWQTMVYKKCPYQFCAAKLSLEKNFKLNGALLSPKPFTDMRYRVDKVETKESIYQLTISGQIQMIDKVSKEEIIIEKDLTFRAIRSSKLITAFLRLKLFGFDVIEKDVTQCINSNDNMIISLHGPAGCGKSTFLNRLEIDNGHKKFIFLDFERFCDEKEEYLKLAQEAVKKMKKDVVLCIVDAHSLISRLNDDNYLYTVLNNLVNDDEVDVKVIISSLDERLLNQNVIKIITKTIMVYPLNNEDKTDYLKYLISKYCENYRFEEGIEKFAKSLLGYTASDIKMFITLLVKHCPDLTLEQLIKGRDSKEYMANHLSDMIADHEALKWSDIGGYEDVKEKMRDFIQIPLLKEREIDTGVLLYGPPGCSKTMFVRALATECGLSLFTVTDRIMSCYAGETEANLRQIITHAKASAPSIVFIDEIDMLIPKRGAMKDSSVSDKLLNELFVMTDGAESKKSDRKVILVATTNRLDNLDEALLRPGRMDLKIEIGLPDQCSREAILKIVFSDPEFYFTNQFSLRIPEIAKCLVNKSGAEIVNIGKEIKRVTRRVFDSENSGEELPTLTIDHVFKVFKSLSID